MKKQPSKHLQIALAASRKGLAKKKIIEPTRKVYGGGTRSISAPRATATANTNTALARLISTR